MILLIDNYDSFVHNLARYFQRLGQETLVIRNDEMTAGEVRRLQPEAIIISPGPCTPAEEGTLPNDLRVTARADDGTIMALEHVAYPVYGVQFHPEAALTQCGFDLL